MNDNLYDIDDDINNAEQQAMRRNEGRRLAGIMLQAVSDGMMKSVRAWNGNEMACVCEAAIESSNLARIAELEKQVAEYQGLISGLNFQLQTVRDNQTVWNDADRYQEECLRTSTRLDPHIDLAVLGLGIAGESGEVADHIKKHVGHGHNLDREKVAKELGDTLWYISAIAQRIDYKLSEIMDMNMQKLRKRYPNGFSVSDSIARVDETDSVPSRGDIASPAGLVDSLVSDLRQGLDVEVVRLEDEPTINSLGPDVWFSEAPVVMAEERIRENRKPND